MRPSAVIAAAMLALSNAAQADPIADLEAAARRGDLQAQVTLGRMLYSGIGIPVDREKALEWNQRAADQGSPEAMLLLSAAQTDDDTSLRRQPPGVRRQRQAELASRARDLARERASQGDPAAIYVVARVDQLDMTGDVATKMERDRQANRLYRVAAERGYVPAEVMMMSIETVEHPRQLRYQFDWAKKAAEHGASEGMNYLGLLYADIRDRDNARLWILRAAELHDLSAINYACEHYHLKIGEDPRTTYPFCGGTPMSP